MKSIGFSWVGDVMIMVESGRPIRDEDWSEFTDEFLRRAPSGGETKVLVLATSSAPSAAQRAKFKSALGGRKVRAAVMSDSVMTRAAIAAFSLFIAGVRGFASQALGGALDHLAVPRTSRTEMEREIARLREAVTKSDAA